MSAAVTAARYPPGMDVYLPGSVKQHPDWPANTTIAQRTTFHDDDATGCTSWLVLSPSSGALYRTEAYVRDWPDVGGATLSTTVTPPP